MASKVVVKENNLKRSRRGKTCLTCVIVLAVIFVIFAGIIGGVGWYLGNTFSTEVLDMPLSDITGVLSELYWANDKKVVTNGFTDADRKGFYGELKENVLLKSDVEVDFDASLKRAVAAYLQGQNYGDDGDKNNDADASETVRKYNDDGIAANEETNGVANLDALNTVLADMIAGVMTRDNLDLDRLREYTEETDDYVFELRDKQFAAFVQFVLASALKEPSLLGVDAFVPSGVELDKVLALKQIRFYGNSNGTNDIGEQTADATVADVTVWLGLQDVVGQLLTPFVEDAGFGWANWLVKFACNVFLPKNVYATLTVPLDSDAPTQIVLNGMSEKKRDTVYKLINGVAALVIEDDNESDGYVQGLLAMANGVIKPYLDAAADTMDCSSASSGTIKIDFIDVLAKYLSQSFSQQDPITKAELMHVFQAVLTSDAGNRLDQLEAYLYTDWYVDDNGKYIHAPADKTGLTAVDYERMFIAELEDKYTVDFGEDATFTDALKAIGISLGGEGDGDKDILDLINAKRFQAALHKQNDELRLRVTDRMLGAALGGQMDSLFGGNETFQNLNLALEAITFVTKPERPGHTYARLAMSVDVQGLISGLNGSPMGIIVNNILPSEIILSMDIDITLNPEAGFEYDKVELMFNDYDKTATVLQTLDKIVPSFNINEMAGQIEQPVRDMILQIDSAVGIVLVPSVVTDEGTASAELEMDDIFTVIAGFALTGEDGEPVVSGAELQQVLLELTDTDGFDGTSHIAENNDDFISEITNKYYINAQTELNTVDDVTDFLKADFTANNFLIKSDNPKQGVYYMSTDDRSMEELEPSITGPQLGALLQAKMRESNDTDKGENADESTDEYWGADARSDEDDSVELTGIAAYELLNVEIYENALELLLAVDTGDMLPEKISAVLDIQKIFVTASVDLSQNDGEKYPVTIKINDMDSTSEEFANLKKIASVFDADFDVQSVVDELGKIMFTQINDFKTSLGGEDGDDFVKFTDGAIKLASFYEYLEIKLEVENSTPETVRQAVQGMFARDEADNTNNYDTAEFIVNRGAAEDYNFADLRYGMSDKVFNGYFESIIDEQINGDGVLEAVQTVALAATDTSDNAAGVRGWLNGNLAESEQLSSSGDYLAVTFRMAMTNFMDSSDMEKYSAFFPSEVYITVVFEKSASGGFSKRGVVFNDMNAQTYELMTSLMRLSPDSDDPDKVNINTIIDTCLSNLNNLGGAAVTFAADDTGKGGIGKITASLPYGN